MSKRIGRPTRYLKKYCAQVIAWGSEGWSKAEMASAIGVSRVTLDAWTQAHAAFLYAMEEARDNSLAWWEKQGRENLITANGRSLNASLYSRSMAARFPKDWTEKKELKQEVKGIVQVSRKS